MSEWKETEFGRVPRNWKLVDASDFCKKVTDGTHDSPKQQTSGRYLITSKHIKGRNIDFDNAYLISDADYEKINERSKVDQWDVIISMIGEYCGFSYIERNEIIEYAVKNVGIFKTGEKNNAFWLYYYIQSAIGKNILESSRSGTSQPYISLGALRSFPVLVPDNIEEQKAIASVLSSLDDKIDLLHRQNKTLEAMAETLFRQWFVEEAQEDWEDGTVADLIEFNPTRKLAKGATAPYLEMAALSTTTFSPDGWYDREFTSGTKFINGDTLLARITPCLENGKAAFVMFLELGEVGWGSTEYIVMRPKELLHPFFAYTLSRNRDFRDYAEGCMEGSSGRQRVNVDHLKNYEMKIPSAEAVTEFNGFAGSTVHKLLMNSNQIRTLERLRDTLLPKLMSGEVRMDYEHQDH
jgi:type I restriction enzyme, S subunit